MLTTRIALIDQTRKIRPAHLSAVAAAIQIQVSRDLARYWQIPPVSVATLSPDAKVPNSVWPVFIVDSLPPGEGGYHWEINNNQPYAKVLNGRGWTVATSHEVCLTGDSKISLLNGSEVPIKDLVGVPEFYVYSCKENGDIRPGRAHSARMTKKDAQIVRVVLDSGESIRCTSDHPFMMRDGTYKEAGSLTAGASLMPLYRQRATLDPKKTRKGVTDYEQVWNPSSQKWVYTHRMVVPYCSNGYVRHHKDFNRFNNCPTNIQVMTWLDHQQVHAQHITYYNILNKGKPKNFSEEARAAAAIRGAKYLIAYNTSDKHKSDMDAYFAVPGVREKHRDHMMAGWTPEVVGARISRITTMARSEEHKKRAASTITAYNQSEEHRSVAREVGKKAMELLWSDPDFVERKRVISSATTTKRNSDPAFQAYAYHRRMHTKRAEIDSECCYCLEDRSEALGAAPNNHKVVSVEAAGVEDVYDITVDKYHNFALSAGIFVHNCEMLVDPWGQKLQPGREIELSGSTQTLSTTRTADYLVEVCDAPEAHGYVIGGVAVSDFVTPAFYGDGSAGPYDFMGRIKNPLEVLPGGYISWIDPTTNDIKQLLWVDPTPKVEDLGPAFGTRSLKEFVDGKTGTITTIASSTDHPAVKLAESMNFRFD